MTPEQREATPTTQGQRQDTATECHRLELMSRVGPVVRVARRRLMPGGSENDIALKLPYVWLACRGIGTGRVFRQVTRQIRNPGRDFRKSHPSLAHRKCRSMWSARCKCSSCGGASEAGKQQECLCISSKAARDSFVSRVRAIHCQHERVQTGEGGRARLCGRLEY